jgi:crotonobetainyl-CoA:carnitine CoA-transferase CaiB-like acyl-CoA transferase
MRGAPAYDQIIQGLSGLMSITGSKESAPLRVGYPVADTLAGMTAAFAISSALVRRHATGEGGFIDVSMLDSALATMGWVVSNYLIAGGCAAAARQRQLHGRALGGVPHPGRPDQHRRQQAGAVVALARVIGRDDLVQDPRFALRESRKVNRHALKAEIEDTLVTRPSPSGKRCSTRWGVPAGAVLTVPQALAQPQVQHRQLLKTYDAVPGIDRPITIAQGRLQALQRRPLRRSNRRRCSGSTPTKSCGPPATTPTRSPACAASARSAGKSRPRSRNPEDTPP